MKKAADPGSLLHTGLALSTMKAASSHQTPMGSSKDYWTTLEAARRDLFIGTEITVRCHRPDRCLQVTIDSFWHSGVGWKSPMGETVGFRYLDEEWKTWARGHGPEVELALDSYARLTT